MNLGTDHGKDKGENKQELENMTIGLIDADLMWGNPTPTSRCNDG